MTLCIENLKVNTPYLNVKAIYNSSYNNKNSEFGINSNKKQKLIQYSIFVLIKAFIAFLPAIACLSAFWTTQNLAVLKFPLLSVFFQCIIKKFQLHYFLFMIMLVYCRFFQIQITILLFRSMGFSCYQELFVFSTVWCKIFTHWKKS